MPETCSTRVARQRTGRGLLRATCARMRVHPPLAVCGGASRHRHQYPRCVEASERTPSPRHLQRRHRGGADRGTVVVHRLPPPSASCLDRPGAQLLDRSYLEPSWLTNATRIVLSPWPNTTAASSKV